MKMMHIDTDGKQLQDPKSFSYCQIRGIIMDSGDYDVVDCEVELE